LVARAWVELFDGTGWRAVAQVQTRLYEKALRSGRAANRNSLIGVFDSLINVHAVAFVTRGSGIVVCYKKALAPDE